MHIQGPEKSYNIKIVKHRNTGLLVATSEDLPGLMVASRSHEELEREVPIAIREMLEARGEKAPHVEVVDGDRLSSDFLSYSMVAKATLEHA